MCECKEENRICAPHTQLIVFDDREQFSENSLVSFMKSDIVGVVVVVVIRLVRVLDVVVCFLFCFCLLEKSEMREKKEERRRKQTTEHTTQPNGQIQDFLYWK